MCHISSQLCKNIPILWWQFHNASFRCVFYMSMGSLKRSTYSNNIKLLIHCYYLHYIFITLLIVEKNPIVFHDKKRKNKFQQFIKRWCPCAQAWRFLLTIEWIIIYRHFCQRFWMILEIRQILGEVTWRVILSTLSLPWSLINENINVWMAMSWFFGRSFMCKSSKASPCSEFEIKWFWQCNWVKHNWCFKENWNKPENYIFLFLYRPKCPW